MSEGAGKVSARAGSAYGARVSVIIPVRDGERYVGEAIESVLAQTVRPLEVVVADDGSHDRSVEVVEGFGPPVICLRGEAEGIGAVLNRGLGRAGAPYLAFLDADDLWLPGKLEAQLAALEADPGLDLVFGHVEQFVSPELDAAERTRIHCPPGSQPGVFKGTMLIRRAAFERVGAFSNELPPTDFVDWYARALDAGLRSLMLPVTVARRRLHGANTGRSVDRANYARIMRAIMERRRAAGAPRPSASDA